MRVFPLTNGGAQSTLWHRVLCDAVRLVQYEVRGAWRAVRSKEQFSREGMEAGGRIKMTGDGNMGLPGEEAKRRLEEIRSTAEQTRKIAAYSGADVILIMWGVIWVAGYAITFFAPLLGAWTWAALIPAGIAGTILISRRSSAVKSTLARRIGWFWLALYVYVMLWSVLLYPFIKVEGENESMSLWKTLSAVGLTIPMFAYVVMGLLLRHMMVWLGLAVTALIVAGLYLIPLPWFWLYLSGVGAAR